MKLFLTGLKNKYRFSTPKGSIDTEKLFDLTLPQLDELYRSLEESQSSSKGLSGRKSNPTITNKMRIVEEIYNYKVELTEKANKRTETLSRKEMLLEAANRKEVEELLEGKSAKELRKEAEKL